MSNQPKTPDKNKSKGVLITERNKALGDAKQVAHYARGLENRLKEINRIAKKAQAAALDLRWPFRPVVRKHLPDLERVVDLSEVEDKAKD